MLVSLNFYTTAPDMNDVTHRTQQVQCESGYACTDGIRTSNAKWNDCVAAGIATPSTTRRIAESTVGNIGAAVAATMGGTTTYSIVSITKPTSCSWTAAGAPTITIDSTGQLKIITNPPDYELCSSFVTQITATAANGVLTCDVNVAVDDVNEGPKLQNCAVTRQVEEQSPKQTGVGTALVSSDPDIGQSLMYSITGGTGLNLFSISACSGSITVANANILYTTAASYTLNIKVTDDGTPALVDACTVTVKILDKNDPPDVLPATFTVSESLAIGALVGTITATDPDVGDVLNWAISATVPPGRLSIDQTGKLKVATTMDFETEGAYFFRVTVTDGRGGIDAADIGVILTDANDPPTLTATTLNVPENSPLGTYVDNPLVVFDPDRGDTFTITITGGNTNNVFAFSGLQLVVNNAILNFEATSTYSLSVTATDKAGASSSAIITVRVLDVNEEPSVVSTTRTIAESLAVGQAVGAAIVGTDVDAGQTQYLLYSITSGNTNTDFSIDASGGILRVARALDFETTPSYSLLISVRDAGGLTGTGTVTVTVTDVNEAPLLADTTIYLAENSPSGTLVGAPLVAVDPEGNSFTWAIYSGNDGTTFKLSTTTPGQLIVNSPTLLDYEKRTEFIVLVKTTDSLGASDTGAVSILIQPVDEAPVWDPVSVAAQRSVIERSVVGTLAGTKVVATDPEGDVVTYAILSQPVGNYYRIDGATGQISVAVQLPSAGGSSVNHVLTCIAYDAGGSNSTQAITVTMIDQNDPPIWSPATRSIAENSPMNTAAGAPVPATDSDTNDVLVYSILSGISLGEFTINPSSAQISVGNPVLDFETTPTYTLTALVRDSRTIGSMSTETTITINVVDMPEAPTMPSAARSVNENSPAGTLIGAPVTGTDPDAGQTAKLQYSIISGRTDLFSIVGTTGQISVKLDALDYEKTQQYLLGVQATDTTGRTGSGTITIAILNVNDAPTFPAFSAALVREDSTVGSLVNSFAGSDQDGDTLTYSIVSGNTNNVFALSASSAQLTVAGPLDFETRSSYSLTIRATDPFGLTATATITVNVVDVNEPPVANTWSTPSIPESATLSSSVFTTSFKDPDAGAVMTYKISDGNVDSVFAINSASGVITVAKALNFEVLASYNLEITATDQGGLSGIGRLAIIITDVNEAPTLLASTQRVKENSAQGTNIGVPLVATDPDAGDVLTYAIVGGNTGSLFSIAGSQLTVNNAVLNYEGVNSYSVQVKATDKGGLSSTATVTIQVLDVNEPPVINDATRRLNENSPINFRVGDPLTATDEDVGQLLAFAIVSGNDLKHFKINPCDGQVQVNLNAINYEAIASYSLVVSVTDDGGDDPGPPRLLDTAVITIIVDNINEAPVVNNAAFSVLENRPVLYSLGFITVNEPDFKDVPPQTQTFTITGGNEDGLFAIDSSTGSVIIARVGLDFETRTLYTLTITSTDSGSPRLSGTGTCTITILDANEPPIVAAQERSVAENTAAGTVIGAALVATDPDAGANGVLTFSLPASAAFTVDASTGTLRVKSPLNFEAQSKYVVTLTVTDGGGLVTTAQITVNILDVNEAPVLLSGVFAIDENSARGTTIGTVAGTDVDAGQVLTYSITSQTPGNAFSIGPISGIITVGDVALNYESQYSYTITVLVVDSGLPQLSATATFTVSVNNVWEAPVIAADQTRTVSELAAVGSNLGGALLATDEDTGDSFSFALSSGNTGNVFAISAAGQLTIAAGLNFEAVSKYSLYVTATDSHGKTSIPTLVSITVTDANEPPVFSTKTFSASVPEDAVMNIRAGLLSATDPDAGSVLTWSLVSDPSNAFKVLPSTGDLVIKTSGLISAKVKYTLSVRVTDQGGLSDDATVTVTVTDINHPPKISDTARSVPENSAFGTLVGIPVVATDQDGDQITYRIESGNDNGAFAINPSTGQLSVSSSSALDFELRAFQLVKVEARDNGPGALASYAVVNVTITNVNEAPVVTAGTMSVKENSPVGTAVGKAAGTDPDRGDTITFSITAGNTGNVFSITNTGAISVAIAVLNAEAIASYALTVTVTDRLGLKGSGLITVTIEDVNDAPVLKDTTRSVAENSALGALVGVQLAVTDEDLSRGIQTLSFSITSGNAGSVFAVSNTGQISVAGNLNFEAVNKYILTVVVADDGQPSLSATATVVVSILDVNEAPTFGAPAYTATIAENTAVGTRVTMVGAAVSATDPEIAYQTLAFSIAGESVFAINPATGVISLRTAVLDFETRSTYDILLQVTDSDATPLTSTATLRINILDVNEAPTWTAVPTLTVKENSPVGTAVKGQLAAADVDAGVNGQLRFTITGGDGQDLFALDENTAAVSVKKATLDFETKSSYALNVVVTDGGGLQAATVVKVQLLDVNEPPVLLPGERLIAENSPESTPIGVAIQGSDVDAGQTLTLSYSLTGGDGMGIFVINACSGQLIVRQAVLDYESKNTYTLQVTVTDDDTLDPAHLSATATYTVKLIDVNEAPKMANAARAVDENSAVGTLVGAALVATDEDRPPQPLAFTFASGNDAGLFAVDNKGQVTVATAALNYEQQSQYSLIVKVADDKGLFTTATLTVSINNINEPPVLAPVTCSVPENSAPKLLVCELVATDQDASQTLTYALQASGNVNGAFSLTSGNNKGRLLVAGDLDFESLPSYSLVVSITDDGMINGVQTTPLTINVATTVNLINVNEAPSMQDQSRAVDENSPLATPVGAPLQASDPDANTFFTYSIVSGNVDNLFSITALSGQITVAAPANFEARSSYQLVVRVADSGFATQLTATATITISIRDVNEAPVLTGAQLSSLENVKSGTKLTPAVGSNAIMASDVDAADRGALVFSIETGNDLNLFKIDAATGEISTVRAVSMDFETQSTYRMVVKVTDVGGLSATAPVTVVVQDVNEAPWLEQPAVNASMKAHVASSVVITKYIGRDQDSGDTLQYFLQGPNADIFAISALRGELTTAAPSDPRLGFTDGVANQVSIIVGVRDRAGLVGTRTMYLNIIDNNAPPTLSGATFNIQENKPAGTIIGTVQGVDIDVTQTLTYSLVSVDPASAAPLFKLTTKPVPGAKPAGELSVADTSQLVSAPKLDYETFKSVSLVIQVSDNGPGLMSASATVVVQLVDVNEAPSLSLASSDVSGVLHVDENVAAGTQVGGRLVASDPDAIDSTLGYDLVWQSGAAGQQLPFSIDNTGQIVVASAVLDYEKRTSYAVKATVTDHAGLTASVSFSIAVTNVNEAPTMAAASMSVQENSAVGKVVGTLTAQDVDAGTVFNFHFAPGTESNPATRLFAINPSTGVVTVAVADLDYERTTSYTVTVRARDNGLGVESLSLYADAQLTIAILDVNDVAITGFNVDGSTTAGTVLHPTDTPQLVTILGRDFGPVSPTEPVTVTASYASSFRPSQVYTATDCSVVTANTVIQCLTVPGAGTQLMWTLTVNGATTKSAMTTSYAPPVISSVGGAAALTTRGGNTVVLTGSNFGPSTTAVETVVYGPSSDGPSVYRYRAIGCSITAAHTQISCKSVPGVGRDLQWRVTIERLSSLAFVTTDTSYARPNITAIAGGAALGTQGGELVTLTGTDFGRAVDGTVLGTYGPDGTGLNAASCTVITDHSVVRCQTSPGVGARHSWILRVGDIPSRPSGAKTSYKPPVITEVSGPGYQDASTRGLEDLYLTGTSFGPLTTVPLVQYGSSKANLYTAVSCTVLEAHSRIACKTAEGTGRGHSVRVQIGGQWSVIADVEQSYAAPMIVDYSGAGSLDAITDGGQVVLIEGRNFGSVAHDKVDIVMYGRNASKLEFAARDCHVVQSHSFIRCNTAPGAGAGLKWSVTIDGQKSGSPTTNYARPVVTAIVGPGAKNALTDGGQPFTIVGKNFGPPGRGSFLEKVTYGVTGTEYEAAGCVVLNHTAIACTTVPGVGASLRFRVTVYGQSSIPAGSLSYAAPVITSASPLVGETPGGITVVVKGTNFGLATFLSGFRTSLLRVTFGGKELPTDVVTGFTSVKGVHSLKFLVPEAVDFGKNRTIQVHVFDLQANMQSSNVLVFQYEDPHITGVFRLRNNVLRIEGDNFGVSGSITAVSKVGVTTVVSSVDCTTYSHSLIEFLLDAAAGSVVVARGEQTSNMGFFATVVPTISALKSDSGTGELFFGTAGGETLTISGYDMGEADKLSDVNITVRTQDSHGNVIAKPCLITNFINIPGAPIPGTTQKESDQQTISCTVPPGQGENQHVAVSVRGSISPASRLNYEHPWIEQIKTNFGDGTKAPTSGIHPSGGAVKLLLKGRNFGVALQEVFLYRCAAGVSSEDCVQGKVAPDYMAIVPNCVFTQTSATCDLPEGDGRAVFAGIIVTTHGDPDLIYDSPFGQYRHPNPPVGAYGYKDGRRMTIDFDEPRIHVSGRRLAGGSSNVLSQTGPTTGGFLLTLNGENFGRSVQPITVTVGPYACAVVSHTHSSVTCRMPPGQGANLAVTVTVAGISNSEKPLFSYLPPTLSTISLTHGPTSGVLVGAVKRQNITLTGTNFGVLGSLMFGANPSDVYQDDIPVAASDVFVWSHTHIVFAMPTGQGKGRLVKVTAGNQISGALNFDYDDPVVDHIIPDTDPTQKEFLPTDGLYNVTVIGRNFGTRYGAAVLTHTRLDAGFRCGTDSKTYQSTCAVNAGLQSHTSMRFLMPRGIGKDFHVSVQVGKESSNFITASYDPPQVTRVRPNQADALGQMIIIDGKNFGDSSIGLNISVHSKPCENPQFISGSVLPGTRFVQPPFLQCKMPSSTVGFKNLTVAIAGQITDLEWTSALLLAMCQRNYYGDLNELCLPCMLGGYCDGGLTPPVSIKGFWMQNATADQCPPERLPPYVDKEYCVQAVACEPQSACTGSNKCSLGYAGERCALCSKSFYRRAGECIKCPDQPLLLVFGFIGAAIVLCCVGYILNKKSVNLAFVSIGVDYFQVLALFANSKIVWPPTLKQLFVYMSAFNFNLEITAPECSIPDLGYTNKWYMIMSLPVAATAMFLLMHISMVFHKFFILGRRKNLNKHASAFVSTGMVMFYYLYLYLTRTALDIFNCAPTTPPDGYTYLEVVFERCDKPGGIHEKLLPLAVVAFIVYSLGFPSVLFAMLYRNRLLIMEDQLLRANGSGQDRLTNPHAYDCRKRYHKLYYHFKPDQWFWILAVILRKGCLAFTALMFNKNPSFQLAMALLVMFLAYTAQVKYRPYMSVSENQAVIRDHQYKAELGDRNHQILAANIVQVQARSKARTSKFNWESKLGTRRAAIAAAAAARYFWNYNTVEMVLLFCAVLVNLAGVMFSSGQLDSEFYASYREGITWAVIFVIVTSVCYFFFVLGSEVYGTICQDKIAKKATSEDTKKADMARKNVDLLAQPGADKLEMAGFVNPIFKAGGVGNNLAEVLDSIKPPDPMQWGLIKEELAKLRSDISELLAANAELKKQVQQGGGVSSAGAVAVAGDGEGEDASPAGLVRPVRGRGQGRRQFAPQRVQKSGSRLSMNGSQAAALAAKGVGASASVVAGGVAPPPPPPASS